jgi:hypothetical protein
MSSSNRTPSDEAGRPLFGPFYPPLLQGVINHLEAFAALINTYRPKVTDEPMASTWLLGRADELTALAIDVLESWRSGTLSDADAAGTLTRYLDDLHDGFRLNVHRAPLQCCRLDLDAPSTATAPLAAAPTVLAPTTSPTTRELPVDAVVRVEGTRWSEGERHRSDATEEIHQAPANGTKRP